MEAVLRITVWLFVAMLAATPAAGQTGINFEFSFSNPGARSLGFGGAFAGLADDATAAFANPAGLVQLVDAEVSVEVRHWSYSMPFTFSGRIGGQPTGIGLDTSNGVQRAAADTDLTGLSFLSFVYPKRKWSLAFYGHQLANFEFATQTQGLFFETPTGTERVPDRLATTDLEIITFGVSGAFRINDRLSLGFGLAYFDGMLRADTEVFQWDEFFEPTVFLPDRLVATSSIKIDDRDWGLNAGLLWRFAQRWRMGAFYREGPEFDVDGELRGGPASLPGLPPPGESVLIPGRLAFPDVYGLGFAFQTGDGKLTVSFEWDRVEYSTIFESLEQSAPLASGEAIDDGDELHLGAEYAFAKTKPVLAIRGGVWLDPDHQVGTRFDDPVVEALLPGGEDKWHYALGFGASFKKFQIDLGADFSDHRDTISLSAIFRF